MGVMELARKWGHEQVVFCQDAVTGLRAIIAIHDTSLGPALGGCRFWDYASDEDAIFDVLRLSRGMTYKAAMADLPLGGGKSVIIGKPQKLKSETLFRHFGRFVHSLGGRYITAEDVNVQVADMNLVAKETPYVTGISSHPGGSGDPSPITALGVFEGIKAAVKFRLKKESLAGLKVAVQGCGAVGRHLCELLHAEGARLVITDINADIVKSLQTKLGAEAVSSEAIYEQEVDIFAPCALGAILNEGTIPLLKAKIVAGAANNQLLDEERHLGMLIERKILYAPDYVINAGGLINVYFELKGYNAPEAKAKTCRIYHSLLEVFTKAEKMAGSTLAASNQIAEQRITQARKNSDNYLKHSFNNQPWIVTR